MTIRKIHYAWMRRFYLLQFYFVTSLILSCALFKYKNIFSLVIGVGCSILPSFIMALLAFKQSGAIYSKKIVKNFFLGELVKVFLTICFILLSMLLFAINIYAFLLGFILPIFGFLWIPIYMDKVSNKQHEGTTYKLRVHSAPSSKPNL